MGLPDKVLVVEALLQSRCVARASAAKDAPTTVGANTDAPSHSADIDMAADCACPSFSSRPASMNSGGPSHSGGLGQLRARVDSLEIWSHSVDAERGEDAASADSVFRARELMEAMLRQVVADGQNEWQDQIASRVAVLERKVEECLLAFGRMKQDGMDAGGSE
eukprot:4840073-Amphidinium_carterae.3